MKNNIDKIKLYFDGPNLDEINIDFGIQIDGYTFNPSLFKKNDLQFSISLLLNQSQKHIYNRLFYYHLLYCRFHTTC